MTPEKNFYTVRGYQLLNTGNKVLTSSMEDYLEMIYRTCMEEDYIRVNQLSAKLNVRPSSTTKIVQKLDAIGLINYQRYGIIKLTESGREVGAYLLNRHLILEKFFEMIGDQDVSLRDTEMIEHDISASGLRYIQLLMDFMEDNPDVKEKYERFKKDYRLPNHE